MPDMQQITSLISSTVTDNSPPSDQAQKEYDPHIPNSLPPWVHVNDGTVAEDDAHLLAHPPERAVPNSRHYKPPPSHYKPGRKWDHLRDAEPPLLSQPIAQHQERWRPFMYSGPNPQEQQAQARVVDQAWMEENMPYLNQGWQAEDEQLADASHEPRGFSGLMYRGKWLISPERQEKSVKLFWRLLLKNPFIPLAFRLAVLAFSAAGLGIAATIFTTVRHVNSDADPDNQCATRASTYMAVCVGAIAIPYLGYVTWDEYMSKPLGLRSVPTKILLLLCDLYFVVFAASNLSLAFDALYDHRWACYDQHYAIIGSNGEQYNVPATCPNNANICYKQKALSGILLVSLLAWLITFSLSIMRVVEKLRPD